MIVIRISGRTLAAAAAALAVTTAGIAWAQGMGAQGAGGVAGGFRSVITPIQELMTALSQIRLTACAPVFQQAGQFLFEDGQARFTVQPLGMDANRWPTAVTMETRHRVANAAGAPAEQTRLTTLVVAPAGTCSGLYNQVIYWPEPCAKVKARVFGAFAGERPMLRDVKRSEANPGLHVHLMPAGAGCVSMKQELIG